MDKYWQVENEELAKESQSVLNDFLLTKKLANKSELTIRRYRGFLEKFLSDINKSIKDLTSRDILDYIICKFKEYNDYTTNGYISILSSFFRYCYNEEYIDDMLVKSRWKPKLPKPLPKYLEKAELAKIKLEAEKSSIRDRVIFELLLCTGCRVAEVHGLNIENIDLKNRTARVLGKGKKIRTIFFTEYCSILLGKYLENHPSDTGALFIGRDNKRISIRTIQRVIKGLGEKACLSNKISPKNLRHTLATVLLSKGASLDFIRTILGHEDIQTTRIYARLPTEQVISLYRRYMG